MVSITLIFTGAIGINLIRSVKKEIEAREIIEKQEKEMERLNVEISLANEKLKSLDQLKSEFLSLASHQLRSPITAIKGYASLLLEGDYGEIPEEVKKVIQTIYTSTQTLAVMVSDFLDISRIEQGSMKYDMTDFDFKRSCRRHTWCTAIVRN